MTYKVRPLNYFDKDWVVDDLGVYTITHDLQRPELVNTMQLRKLFDLSLQSVKGFVVESDGKPVGVLGGIQHGHILNPDHPCYTVLFWFIDPTHRKSRAAWLLLKAVKEFCRENGKELSFALQTYSLSNTSALPKLGFEVGETTYRMKV